MNLLVWLQVTRIQDPTTLSLLLCSSAEEFGIQGDKGASPSLDLCSNSVSPRQWWGSSSFVWGAFCSLIGVRSLSRLTVGRGADSFLSGSFSHRLSRSNLDMMQPWLWLMWLWSFPEFPAHSHALLFPFSHFFSHGRMWVLTFFYAFRVVVTRSVEASLGCSLLVFMASIPLTLL